MNRKQTIFELASGTAGILGSMRLNKIVVNDLKIIAVNPYMMAAFKDEHNRKHLMIADENEEKLLEKINSILSNNIFFKDDNIFMGIRYLDLNNDNTNNSKIEDLVNVKYTLHNSLEHYKISADIIRKH